MLIKDYMTQEHRACDAEFAKVEECVNAGDFEKAKAAFDTFKAHTLKHFAQEEELLFVKFVEATGMSGGPVEVMTFEHNQMRGLLEQIQDSLEKGDEEAFFGLSDSMMILLQQHNMKEEQMLYNMIQMHLGASNNELVAQLSSM